MFNFKRRQGKDKKETPKHSDGKVSHAGTDPPSTSTVVSPDAEAARRASGASTYTVPYSDGLERLPSGQNIGNTFGPSSTFGPERPRAQTAQSYERNSDPLGLIVVHEPETSPPLDIIFVHGLGGTSRATWAKGRDLEYFWPQKWLPFEPGIRNARILSWGYNANFAATGPTPITRIADFAKELLYDLKFAKNEKLEDMGIGQRPIIFIVHSMGGLIVKEAYILGHSDEKFSGIVSSISAIMFLATPHRGSNFADILNRILSVSIFNHSSKLYITELKTGSQTIAAINDQFRHFAPRLDILSFYETLPTSVGPKKMMVVEKDSATLGYKEEISKSLNADHHTVCKFTSTEDANYISVRNALKTLVTNICSKGQCLLGTQEKTEVEQLETLLVVSENHKDDLEFFRRRWTAGTCDWILSNPAFNKWFDGNEKSTQLLWLHALPASGKSILSSFIINHLLDGSFCAYYFFRFGDQSKRSLSTCLRTITFQIAKQFPQFRQALREMTFATTTLEKMDPKTIWEKIFVGLLFKMRFTSTIYWVIDALDESDHPQLLVELMQNISVSSTPIKVLLVSRQTPELITTFERLSIVAPVVYLPLENTKKDIRICVQKEVQYMHAPAEFRSQVVEKLVSAAIGNFLWASLALEEVLTCNTQEDLDETLEGIPSGMQQLYQRMERTIIERTKPRDQKLGQMILMWAACSRRPLSLRELSQALQPEFAVLLELKFTINRVCGQFVVIDATDQLVMVHQTARDHIISTNSALAVNVTECHEKLFTKCLSVLEEKQRREANRHLASVKATENQEFVRYAMTSWPYHLNLTSSDSDKPLLLLSDFLKSNSVLAWILALAQQNQLKMLVYASKSINLYVRRKRGRYAATNPLLHRLQELELLESWANDFLKILGKFGRNLTANPTSIYHQIPSFCPKNSSIYRQYEQNVPHPHLLSVEGLSRTVWDDSLAKISLRPGSRALAIACSGDHFAVQTGTGTIILYNSVTFETRQTLRHAEQVSALSFSDDSNMLVSYGSRTTKVWSVKTGTVTHEIRNPGSRAFAITFSAGNTKLVIGSNDRLLRVAQLTVADSKWSVLHPDLLKNDTALDRPVQNVPLRIAFNADANCVAVAYRSSPLCVWAIDSPKFIGRCMRSQEYAGNSWTVVDQVIWHPKSEEVLGLYMGGHVFRWNPYDNTQQELRADASIIASSQEGKFFVTGDSNGIIKLYNFHHFALIYQLSCEYIINDICFSPDSKRLYDVRGQFCNIWEPNALIRADETSEHESEVGSEVASIPTAAVSEAFAEVRDQITALAIQFGGRYHAIGNEAGVVSVVDSVEGEHSATQVWRSPVTLPIRHLAWSSDGNYLACAESTGKVVVKRMQVENDHRWTVRSVFEVKLNISSEGFHQVLLDNDGAHLLVRNGPRVIVWSLGVSTSSTDHKRSIASPNTWIVHPTEPTLLLAFGPSIVQVYHWEDLSEVATLSVDEVYLSASEIDRPPRGAAIRSVFTNPTGSHVLVDSAEGQTHSTYIIDTISLTLRKATQTHSILAPMLIPLEIQQQIEIPLGILTKQHLIFLDKDYWMCSWRLGANLTAEKVQRYYFLPKDWLNIECLGLCALLADGRFLIPQNGELAVIRRKAGPAQGSYGKLDKR